MLRISWNLTQEDLYLLLASDYDRIAFYRSDGGETGTFTEVTSIGTRVSMRAGVRRYEYVDDVSTEATETWYKISYFQADDITESPLSNAFLATDPRDKVGWSFDNYKPPSGLFGDILTADDMRYTYMWGIDEIASDIDSSSWDDNQYKFFVESAIRDMEAILDIDIYRRVYKTQEQIDENNDYQKADFWMEGVDYTDIEPAYDFDPDSWLQYGFLALRHRPILSIDKVVLRTPLDQELMDLTEQEWVRIKDADAGQINLFPKTGLNYTYSPYITGPFMYQQTQNGRYPQGLDINYSTGYTNAGKVPESMRDIIGKYATIKSLATIGDGLIAGVANTTLTIDGITESFSSTQSATSSYFGARINQYTKDINIWMKTNRHRFGGFPLAFVGGR